MISLLNIFDRLMKSSVKTLNIKRFESGFQQPKAGLPKNRLTKFFLQLSRRFHH